MLVEFQATEPRQRIVFSLKPTSLAIMFDEREVYSFDLEGRLLTAWMNDQTYIRTLDNRVVKKWRERHRGAPWKHIEELKPDEKRQFLSQVWSRMQALLHQLAHHELRVTRSDGDQEQVAEQLVHRLDQIVNWNVERLERERERFAAVYTPVTILPPDQYLSLVLQATEGCHWNRCTFCHFYRHQRFHIKSEEEFIRHIEGVKQFFGQGIRLRRSIFLGDANALVIPQERLIRFFDLINEAFIIADERARPEDDGSHVFRGIYSFIDAFTGYKKTEADFRQLRRRHLRRVYLGVETGSDELLKFLNKPATAEQALEVTRAVKRAGLRVGVIILIGAGGDRYFREHIDRTIQLLNAMPLGRGDIIYFSPLFPSPDSEYRQRAAEEGIRALTDAERRAQLDAIRSGLRFPKNEQPKISLYDIREFVY